MDNGGETHAFMHINPFQRNRLLNTETQIVELKKSDHISVGILWKAWRMERSTHTLWNTEEVLVVPAMISGTKASSMLSTSGMDGGWGRESSKSTPAVEDDAPVSSPPTTTSSITSSETGDSSSPKKERIVY